MRRDLFVVGILCREVHDEGGERTTYVKGETIRDTITCFIPDTVRLSGEVRYKYRYKTDTVYRDVPTVDREGTLKKYDRGLEFNSGLQEDLVR